MKLNRQKSRVRIVVAAFTLAAAVLATGSARADLYGSVINVSAYYPNTSSVSESGLNETVSGAIEYPVGTFPVYDRFAQIDITDDQIVIENTLNMGAPYNSAAFNGWVLSIISGPTILSAVADPASQSDPVGISIVNGNQLFLNFEGVTQGAGASSIIDIQTTPEPSAAALLGIGLFGAMIFHRRSLRRRSINH